MEPKEYIASGILESYALGATTPEQSKEVECMARVFPEVMLELNAIQKSLEILAQNNTKPKDHKTKCAHQ